MVRFEKRKRTWAEKFGDAFRGMRAGARDQASFAVHFAFVAAVVIVAAVLRMDLAQWCLLILCIAAVLSAEMFNSALEAMARAITEESNPHLGKALDIASAAVLVAAIGAAAIGILVFGHRAGTLLGWW